MISEIKKDYLLDQLSRYWSKNVQIISDLPIPRVKNTDREKLPPILLWIELPDWAKHCGVVGKILVPAQFIQYAGDPKWKYVDWLSTAFWYLNATAERKFEDRFGPIHSYSFRLKSWNRNIWKYAWVNRIAMFLRASAAHRAGRPEEELFGSFPHAEIILTHDLDATEKTLAIRFKQSAFQLFNASKSFIRGDFDNAKIRLRKMLRFAFENPEYNNLYEMAKMEADLDLKAYLHVYGGRGGWRRGFRKLLFDPAYSVKEKRLRSQLAGLSNIGWTIGLHQSYEAWRDYNKMFLERDNLEEALGAKVETCRQHWLRFSWKDTWKAQTVAGLKKDFTLGFNDRPGFRNASALAFQPWDEELNRPLRLTAVPLALMDSQLYDYADFDDEERRAEMEKWINEIKSVGGVASVLWHPHTLSSDYGWKDGFENLLKLVA